MAVKVPKPDPAQVYVALDGFVTGNPPVTVRAGDRVRGTHPAVIAHPELFAPDGLTDDELHALRRERSIVQH